MKVKNAEVKSIHSNKNKNHKKALKIIKEKCDTFFCKNVCLKENQICDFRPDCLKSSQKDENIGECQKK